MRSYAPAAIAMLVYRYIRPQNKLFPFFPFPFPVHTQTYSIQIANMSDVNNLEPVDGEKISRLDLDYKLTHCYLVEPGEVPTLEEAKAIIDRLYASGVPFFTKEIIQDMWDHIKRDPVEGDKILSKDITGAVVECDVETGKVRQWWEDDLALEFVW